MGIRATLNIHQLSTRRGSRVRLTRELRDGPQPGNLKKVVTSDFHENDSPAQTKGAKSVRFNEEICFGLKFLLLLLLRLFLLLQYDGLREYVFKKVTLTTLV